MVDKSRSRGKNGAGLGLALCVEILRLHDSELVIESTLGKGTSIHFVIPDRTEGKEDGAGQDEGSVMEKAGESAAHGAALSKDEAEDEKRSGLTSGAQPHR